MMKRMAIWATASAILLILAFPAGAFGLNYSVPSEAKVYQFDQWQSDPEDQIRDDIITKASSDFSEKEFASGGNQHKEDFSCKANLYRNIFIPDGFLMERPEADLNPATDSSHLIPVPEPATLVLLGSGLIGLTCLGRRRRRLNSLSLQDQCMEMVKK